MAELLDRFKSFIGIGGIEEYYDDNDDSFKESNSENEPTVKNTGSSRIFENSYNNDSSDERFQPKKHVAKAVKGDEKVVNLGSSAGLRVVLSKPTEFDNCQTICSHLRAQMTVVLNLEYVSNSNDKKRIFDFVSGCCFALDCNIQKVSDFIYIIAPYNVDVFAELDNNEVEKESNSYSFSANY